MKLTAEQLAQFDRDGYLFFPSLFSPEETRVLRDEAPRLYAQDRVENVREKGKTVVRTNFAAHMYSAPFAALGRHPRMIEPVEQIFGEKLYMHQFKVNGKMAFDGDVYDGLSARALDEDALAWAQAHVCVLSGLYGVLRPLDWMQPYRLEMGTRLPTEQGSDLYQFWGSRITDYLNERLQGDAEPVLVNLASQEYFKSVKPKLLKARVIECVFEDYKNGVYKIISFNAKRARGAMMRFAIEQRMDRAEQLRDFNADGYKLAAKESTPERLVFRRKLAGT